MNKFLLTIGIIAIGYIFCTAQEQKTEQEKIKFCVEQAINALSNTGEIAIMKKYFHPGFEIMTLKEDNRLHKTPIYNWLEKTTIRKKQNKYPPEKKVTIEFENIEITGNAAIVKFKYYKGEIHTCTDFMCLYKFNEGWRIVSAITYHHQD